MVDYLIHFIVSIPNKWTLMISIALSFYFLKEGTRCRSINHTYMLRSQIYTPYDTQEGALHSKYDIS